MTIPSLRPAWGARLVALAERDPRRAGLFAVRALATPTLEATALFAVGWALMRWERLDAAIDALTTASERLSHSKDDLALRCRRTLMMARQIGGAGIELQNEWETLARDCVAAGDMAEAACVRCEQAAHLNLLGRADNAWTILQHNAPLVRRYGSPADRARHQYLCGVAATSRAEFTVAQGNFDAACAAFDQLGHPAEAARARFERALLWLRRERLDLAQYDLEQALAIYRRLDLPLRVALCTRDLGVLARYRGEYDQAITLLVSARDQFVAIDRPDRAAGCDFNLGAVAHMSGLFDLAMAAYLRAERLYTDGGDQFYALVAARNQALALCAQGQHDDALALIERITPRFAASGDRLGQAELQATRAQALRALGRIVEAASELQDARAQFQALGNSPAAAECQLDLGWLHLEQGRLVEAHVCLREAEAPLADRPAHHWRVRYGLGRLAEAMGETTTALDHYSQAVTTVAALRRRLASEHASSGLFSLARQLHDDALGLAAREGDGELVLALAEQGRGLVFGRQLRAAGASHESIDERRSAVAASTLRASMRGEAGAQALDAAINSFVGTLLHERHRMSAPRTSPKPLSLVQIRERLNAAFGTDWSVLSAIMLRDEVLLAGLTPDGVMLERQPLDADLRRLIERACLPRYRLEQYRDLARLRDPSRPAWAHLRVLARRLIPEWLCERLTSEHRLFIIPSGPLYALPWAAMRLDDAWLCERSIIELLPALDLAPADRLYAQGPALLVGCDVFGDRAVPLPAARELLELAARHWPHAVQRLEGAAATCAAIRHLSSTSELMHYRLIHIAAHAQLGGADGLLAHIKLADDDLLLDDVLRLQLHSPLVVLAACEGGAGAVLPGDEVLGLTRAFLAAGAASVLANLWPIYDRSVLAIMEPLYRSLAAGADAAAALATAQRTLIARERSGEAADAILQTPLIWAGFTVTSSKTTHDDHFAVAAA